MGSRNKAVIRVSVEEDPRWLSPYGAARDSNARALYSAIVTLTLGVLGSTILPVPYAFSKIGISIGVLTIAVVASVNVVTCCMLVRAAAFTGCYSYEELAEWAGGRTAKVITQTSLILLLYGTMCGGLAFLSDVARIMIQKGLPDSAPALLKQDGRPVMILVVVLVLLPLCLQRHIRQFEKAATVGVVVVVALCVVIICKAVKLGFPAVRTGELPLFSLKVDSHLPEAFSVLGFAFYMQPMLMPVLKEMPRGPGGVAVSEQAVHIVLYVVASLTYGTVGVFGAAIYGQHTESNIMVNDILDDARATFVLYAALMLYLCCGMVTTHYALRASVDALLVGPNAPYTTSRHVLQTVCIISAAMAVAVTFPTQAEKIFALTGCTAVCLACYMIPVYIHFKVQARMQAAGEKVGSTSGDQDGSAVNSGDEAWLGPAGPDHDFKPEGEDRHGDHLASQPRRVACNESLQAPLLVGRCSQGEDGTELSKPSAFACVIRMVKPCFVLAVGVGCSLAGLWVAAIDFYTTYLS